MNKVLRRLPVELIYNLYVNLLTHKVVMILSTVDTYDLVDKSNNKYSRKRQNLPLDAVIEQLSSCGLEGCRQL